LDAEAAAGERSRASQVRLILRERYRAGGNESPGRARVAPPPPRDPEVVVSDVARVVVEPERSSGSVRRGDPAKAPGAKREAKPIPKPGWK